MQAFKLHDEVIFHQDVVDSAIFGTGKFFKEQMEEKKENIYSNIDDMLSRSLKTKEE